MTIKKSKEKKISNCTFQKKKKNLYLRHKILYLWIRRFNKVGEILSSINRQYIFELDVLHLILFLVRDSSLLAARIWSEVMMQGCFCSKDLLLRPGLSAAPHDAALRTARFAQCVVAYWQALAQVCTYVAFFSVIFQLHPHLFILFHAPHLLIIAHVHCVVDKLVRELVLKAYPPAFSKSFPLLPLYFSTPCICVILLRPDHSFI